jgi:hypothetical protein
MPSVVDLDLGPRSFGPIRLPETIESEVIAHYSYTPDALSAYVKWGQMSAPSDRFIYEIW